MANRIRVATEDLQKWASDLMDIYDGLSDAASSLRAVDVDDGGAGDVRMRMDLNLRSCSYSLRARTILDAQDALLDSLRKIEQEIRSTRSDVISAARLFDQAEKSVERLMRDQDGESISQVYKDSASGNLGQTMYKYTIKYNGTKDVLDKNREKWESGDDFLNTEYNRLLMRDLEIAIKTDPALSEAKWNECKSKQEKEAFIQNAYDKIEEIFQTSLSQDIIFVYDSDYIVKNGNKVSRLENAPVKLNNGVTITLSNIATAGYEDVQDVIMVNLDKATDFSEILGTLCHENRHNLQTEILNASDLDKYDGVNGEDYWNIRFSRWDWDDKYYVPSDSEIMAREREILNQMDANQRQTIGQNAYVYAYSELYAEYAKHPKEVDARYVEEKVEKWVKAQGDNVNHDGPIKVLDIQEFVRHVKEQYPSKRTAAVSL